MDAPTLFVLIAGSVFILFIGGVAVTQKFKDKPKAITPPKKRRK